MDESNGLYVIRSFTNDLDARIAEAALEAHGIQSIVVSDNAFGMIPALNTLHPVRLMVREADVEAALALLED